jgi:chromatin remodeling complex protein RSC6
MPRKIAKDSTEVTSKVEVDTTKKTNSEPEVEITPASDSVAISGTDTPLTPSKKPRQIHTRETILSGFDELIEMLEAEINQLRDSSAKHTNIKFLRLLNKNIKALRIQSTRVMKQKTLTPRQNNHNSGFQKPVKISNQLAKFTGWPEDELRSRVDVTKYICDYIATNKLQNPEDKRQIWPDAKLQKLLGFNPSKDKTLYYYGIQTYLKNQNHFPKDEN